MRSDMPLPSFPGSAGRGPAGSIVQLLHHALRQLDDVDPVDRAACANYIAQALEIHRRAMDPAAVRASTPGLAVWQVRLVHELALSRLDAPLAITRLAAACKLSRGYFTRAFKMTFGDSPHRWRHGKRIEHARDRLSATADSIAEIALTCGFNDQAHFTRAFKVAVGMTPATYRQRVG